MTVLSVAGLAGSAGLVACCYAVADEDLAQVCLVDNDGVLCSAGDAVVIVQAGEGNEVVLGSVEVPVLDTLNGRVQAERVQAEIGPAGSVCRVTTCVSVVVNNVVV